LPEGKRSPPPATPSFKVENTNTANQSRRRIDALIQKIQYLIRIYASTFLLFFSQRLVGPRRRVPIMKHSHLVRVTRLSHPKEFEFSQKAT
jgi:hypothetical protein